MDVIHEVDKKPWISKKVIKLKELVPKREKELLENGVLCDSINYPEVSQKNSQLLDELSKFVEYNEKEMKPFFLFNSSDEKALFHQPTCELKMYQIQLEHAQKMISDRAYKVDYLSKLRTTRKELLMRHLALTNRDKLGIAEVSDRSDACRIQAIVVVQLWPQPQKSTKISLEKEVLFRADQCLTELRDQFKCQRDYGVPMDLSENPEQAERIFRGELFKSGFFLIGNTFYNDMRDPNNTDLSANIVDWASKEVVVVDSDGENRKVSRGIEPLIRARMEEHNFEDLEFKLGRPYLYLHQGDCEHLFTISDIRYVPNNLKLRQTKFPFITATSIGRKADNLRCYMCRSKPPHWYTRNNSRLPVDPFFFCEECFNSFNYDKDKKKIGSFQAYLYTSSFGIPDSVVMAEANNKQT